MEIDTKSFSCDIIVEEKFIPDDNVNEEQIIEIDHNVSNINLDQINLQNQDQEKNLTENNEKLKKQLSKDGQLFKCICNKMYQTYGGFKKHEKICQFQKNNLIVCRTFRCYQTFTNQNEFEQHKLNGLCKSGKKKLTPNLETTTTEIFTCDHEGCSAKFPTKMRVCIHKRNVHIPRKFSCLYCDLTFKSKAIKIQHELGEKRKKRRLKLINKFEKSKEFQVKKVLNTKIKTEIEKKDCNSDKITRNQEKKTIYEKIFDIDKRPESDVRPDTSTTASFNEVDIDNENNQVLKVSKADENAKINQIIQAESDEYLCSRCYESFTKKMDAKNHEKNCQNLKSSGNISNYKITCEDCDQVFMDTGKYNYHIDYYHRDKRKLGNWDFEQYNNNKRACFLCKKVFKSKKYLDEHMKFPHKINCTKCLRIFVESAHLERHIKFVHSEDLKKFQCSKCTKKFMTEKDVKIHNRVVHERKMKICPICSNNVTIHSFLKHIGDHKKSGSVKSFCTICQVYLANKTALEKHFGTKLHLEKDTDEKEEFILPHDLNTVDSILIKKRSDKGIYDPTINSKLSKKNISTCPTCGLKFKNFYHKETHRAKYHGYERKKFYCKICDMNFIFKNQFTYHIEKSIKHKMKKKEIQ